MVRIELYDLLSKTQEYIAKYYAAVLTDAHKRDQLKSYIEKFILDGGYLVHGFTEEQLIDRLYSEMVEYSILTPFLGASDLDEININAWDDITLTYSDGSMKKLEEHFRSPQHAIDIVKRLLHHSGMIIDNATPIAQGHLPGNTRITAIKTPVVDEDVGIAVSIRLLHPQRVDRSHIIESGMATEEMIAFLEMCIRYGVSVVIAGRTSSGKTTLMNALLGSIPDDKRIYTIESGARELYLVKKNRFGEKSKVLILFKDIDTCYAMIKGGMELKSVQLGGVPQMGDRRAVKRAVFLGEKEMQQLKELHDMGVEITAQLIPEDSKYDYDEIVKVYNSAK